MIAAASKAFFHLLAGSGLLKRLASRYGMSRPTSFARRFIAGESIEEAVAAARAVEQRGLALTLDYLGESVSTLDEAGAATREYLDIIDRVVQAGIGRNISLKLTQLGLDLDRAAATENLTRILDAAAGHGFFVRIDMESSQYTDLTLEIFRTLWGRGYRNLGVVLQAALRRSERDADDLIALGARIRLVKGAYLEPPGVAYQTIREVDAAYERMMQRLLRDGTFPAIATHDAALIDRACAFASREGIAPDRFEFQMLYGVRRDLQSRLAREGWGVRVYIPFGRQWFPYFMRRLGERPANAAFVLRSLIRERT